MRRGRFNLGRGSERDRMMSLLHELLKDSSRSDRELGRAMGVSQPTVSRWKKLLLEKGVIRGFTVMPNFSELGYGLMALTFVKMKSLLKSAEERQKGRELVKKWMMEQPNVVFCSYCRGLDVDGFMISFHKSYADFDQFILKHNEELGYRLNDVKNLLVSLADDQIIKCLNFEYLAEALKRDV
jgi:DNA-binding Lrp family transcriptional regulator